MKEGEYKEAEDGKLPDEIEFTATELVTRLRKNGHVIEMIKERDMVSHACSAAETDQAGILVMADVSVDGNYYCIDHGVKAMKILDAAEKKIPDKLFRQKEKDSHQWTTKN